MDTGDGAWAWHVLRRIPEYRRAWRRRRPPPGLAERAPFPIRLQTVTDLAAKAWGLLAWEDPFAEEGPVSPFWVEAPMLDAGVAAEATPFVPRLAVAGGSVAGLRLADGPLIIKIEHGTEAVQLRLESGSQLGDGDGVMAMHDVLRPPDTFKSWLEGVCAVAAGEVPRPGGGRGTKAGNC